MLAFAASTRLVKIIVLFLTVAHTAQAADHPGNIFLVGQDVRVSLPDSWTSWRAIDLEEKEVGAGAPQSGHANLGKLPIGYYELRQKNDDAKDPATKITAGVIADSTPSDDTPIALDAACAWFYADPDQLKDAAILARLGGVKWVRDRASWPELEPSRGTLAPEGRYERAMRIQHDVGLKVLQVNHASPPWANANGSRFPDDLRDVFSFYRALAKRWKGLADAIEPWNEPDIEMFGGHTGSEIASFQKAAFLGLRAGDPDLVVNGTVFAIDRPETLDEFRANDVHPYFDRYGLHHYIKLDEYPRAYARHRATSAGRPLWTTEFNLPVWWADEKTKEPSDEELRYGANRVGKTFALALHEGSEKAFFFILGDYVERNLQYGLVHKDLTPRPSYIAFAAVGRLLNNAKPLGRLDLGNDKLKAYLFQTLVDGKARRTLVAWSETDPTTVEFKTADRAFDVLGRELPRADRYTLERKTLFLVFPDDAPMTQKLIPPPANPPMLEGKPSPVVLQLLGPTDFRQSAFLRDASKPLQLVAYNFSDQPAAGTFTVENATGVPQTVTLDPNSRTTFPIRSDNASTFRIRLDLADKTRAVVSARIVESATTQPTSKH